MKHLRLMMDHELTVIMALLMAGAVISYATTSRTGVLDIILVALLAAAVVIATERAERWRERARRAEDEVRNHGASE